jgi:DNA-directed RNA polymerase subunit RPC12/RpoP
MVQYDCHQCGKLTDHLTISEAVQRAQKNWKTIKTWVKRRWVSFTELPSGRIYICAECLLKPRDQASETRAKLAMKASARSGG